MFQDKIIYNILPTQSTLFHACITDTDVCHLCNLESQSLRHMLITCKDFQKTFFVLVVSQIDHKSLYCYEVFFFLTDFVFPD